MVALLVQVLHLAGVQEGRLDALGGAKSTIDERAGAKVAQLRLHDRLPLSGGHVREVVHLQQVAVHIQDHAPAYLGCGNAHVYLLLV